MVFVLLFTSCSGRFNTSKYFDYHPDSWSTLGKNNQRTSFVHTDLTPPLEVVWEYKTGSAVSDGLIAKDGVLYFATVDGRTYAIDIQSGKKIDKDRMTFGIKGSPAIEDQLMVYGLSHGKYSLVAIDLNTGKRRWKKSLGDIEASPVLHKLNVYIGTLERKFHSVNAVTGNTNWSFETGKAIRSTAAYKDGTIVFGCDDGFVYALNADNGDLKWKFDTGKAIPGNPSIDGGMVFIGSTNEYFYALDAATGKSAWKHFLGKPPYPGVVYSGAAISETAVVFGTSNGFVLALDKLKGQPLWTFDAGSIVSTIPVVTSTHVYFGSMKKMFFALNLDSGTEVWRFETPGRIKTSPAIYDGYLFIASERRHVFALREPNMSTATKQ